MSSADCNFPLFRQVWALGSCSSLGRIRKKSIVALTAVNVNLVTFHGMFVYWENGLSQDGMRYVNFDIYLSLRFRYSYKIVPSIGLHIANQILTTPLEAGGN